MPKRKDPAASKYEKQFRQRLKMARESADLSQGDMARHLGLGSGDTYAKYENRPGSMLPTRLIAPVCDYLNLDPWWLLTGKSSHTRPQKPSDADSRPPHSRHAAP